MGVLTVLLALLQLGLSAAAPPTDPIRGIQDNPASEAVVSVSFSGSGCPQGTTNASTTGLWEHFAFDLPSFRAASGPTSSVSERTVNCQAHMNFEAPTGWQFALKEHLSRGHFEADHAGVTLSQYLTVYLSQDAAHTATVTRSIPSTGNPATSKTLRLHTTIPDTALIWSPCNGSGILNVNFRMAFTGTTGNVTAYYGAGNNVPVSEQWWWAWRRC
ncbi:hypothetical protein F4777DRAFT_579085 [Nemania sp. FL0916]|nr:hypothetical protein F4777DRAFT_579085 [Nemania sp. FL0916]